MSIKTAIIKDNKVERITIGLHSNGILLLPGELCEVGFSYEPNSNPRFIKQPVSKSWTSYEFMNKLTQEERSTIRSLSTSDQNIADFLMLAQYASEIISDDPITTNAMNYMVSIGVFSEERKKEILEIP
jgi:hypothetical protein